MNYKTLDLEQGSQEWLDYRKNKITASVVADCIGVKGSFRSPKERALIMKGLKNEYFTKIQSEKMSNGLSKEGLMLDIAIAKFDTIIYRAGVYESTINPLFLASLDARSLKDEVIFEFKYSKAEYEFVKKNNKPSPKYYAQVQFQLMVVDDAPYAQFGVMNPENETMIFIKVERDNEFILDMTKKINSFIEEYLLKDISPDEPELDDKEALELASELLQLKEKVEFDLQRIDEIKKYLQEKGKNFGKKCSCNGVLIYPSTRKSVDYKAFLEAKNLKVDDEFIKESTSWCVKI